MTQIHRSKAMVVCPHEWIFKDFRRKFGHLYEELKWANQEHHLRGIPTDRWIILTNLHWEMDSRLLDFIHWRFKNVVEIRI